MFLINTLITIHFIFVNRRCYHISVPTIKKDYVKTFNFIFYSCTLIVMPLMVFALIRLKKRVLKIEHDHVHEKESMAIMCYFRTTKTEDLHTLPCKTVIHVVVILVVFFSLNLFTSTTQLLSSSTSSFVLLQKMICPVKI